MNCDSAIMSSKYQLKIHISINSKIEKQNFLLLNQYFSEKKKSMPPLRFIFF